MELIYRFCRTRDCIYVETGSRDGQLVHCFQDFRGRRFYRTAEEFLSELARSGNGTMKN